MALYVSAGRRRRNVVLGLAAALVVGLVIGTVIGRASAPSVSGQVAGAQSAAREIAARVRSTPLEYTKQLNGSTEFRSGGTVAQTLAEARKSLTGALGDAEWLGSTARHGMESALDELITAVENKVTAGRYESLVNGAARRIDQGFGIDGS